MTAVAMLRCRDRLLGYGGEIQLSAATAKSFLKRFKFVTRKKTQDKLFVPANHEEATKTHHDRCRALQNQWDLPACLWFNADEMGVQTEAGSTSTLAPKGSKQVFGGPVKCKNQVTVMNLISADGHVPFVTIIFKGKTTGVHPKSLEPSPGVIFDHAPRHFQTVETMLRWVNVFILHVKQVRQILAEQAGEDVAKRQQCLAQKAILIMDNHSTHINSDVKKRLTDNGIIIELLPPNATSWLQGCDVNYNSVMKKRIRLYFQEWLNAAILDQYRKHQTTIIAAEKKQGYSLTADEKKQIQVFKNPIPETAAEKRVFIARFIMRAFQEMRTLTTTVLTAWDKVGLYEIIHKTKFISMDMRTALPENDIWDLTQVSVEQLQANLHLHQQLVEEMRVSESEESEEFDQLSDSDDDNGMPNVDPFLDRLEEGELCNLAENLHVSTSGEFGAIPDNLLHNDNEVQASQLSRSRRHQNLWRQPSAGWAVVRFEAIQIDGRSYVEGFWHTERQGSVESVGEILQKHAKLKPNQFELEKETDASFLFTLTHEMGTKQWVKENSMIMWQSSML